MYGELDIDREKFAQWLFEEDQRQDKSAKKRSWTKLPYEERERYYGEARVYTTVLTPYEWPKGIVHRLGYFEPEDIR